MSLRALYIQYEHAWVPVTTTTTYTMRLTTVNNLPVILLALAVGAAAFPVPGIMSPVHKDPLVKGPSNLLFCFFSFRFPFLLNSSIGTRDVPTYTSTSSAPLPSNIY